LARQAHHDGCTHGNLHTDPALRIIDYEIEIKPVDSPLTFKDTKEGTFGIRLATALAEEHGGRMVNAEGQETEKMFGVKRSPWVDYYGKINGETVGVAIFDNPSNPRYPTYWMSRALVSSPPISSACMISPAANPRT